MAELIRWNGTGLSGPLTTASAGPGDTPPSFITGNVPTIEPALEDTPAIRFDQVAGVANYAAWNFSIADITAYGVRVYQLWTAFVVAGQQHVVQFTNAAETLFSWGVTVTSARLLSIIDKNGSNQATGTVPLVPGVKYRIDITANGAQYDVWAYVGRSLTPHDHVSAVLAAPVAGGRLRWGNNSAGPIAPPNYGDSLAVYNIPAFPDPTVIGLPSTDSLVIALRKLINQPDNTPPYDDGALLALLAVAGNDLNVAAAQIWSEKAASYSELVDVKEGSSSRNLGDLYEQAIAMHAHFRGLTPAVASARRTRVNRIERP